MMVLVLEGLAIGILLGLTGAGGGILAVPALVASQGWTVAEAAPVGLLAVTFSSFVATIQGLFQKIVRYRAAIWIAIFAIPSAHFGVQLAAILPKFWMVLAFAVTMTIVASRIFLNKDQVQKQPVCQINPKTGRFIWNKKSAFMLGSIGVLAGFLTGLLGVGGGFILVPALKKTTSLNIKSIVSTSLMIIFLIGCLTIGLHLLDGYRYPPIVTGIFVCACIIGLLVGHQLLKKMNTQVIQNIFAVAVIGVAGFMYYKAYALL